MRRLVSPFIGPGLMKPSLASRSWTSSLQVAVPLVTLPVFLAAALPMYTVSQRLLAWLVFAIGTAPGFYYLARPRGVPLIELVGLQYAMGFGLSVFFESGLQVVGGSYIAPDSRAITKALLCSALAFVYIFLGYTLATRVIRPRRTILAFQPPTGRLLAYGVAVTGSALLLLTTGIGFSAALSGPMEVALPRTLGLAALACLFYGAQLRPWQRVTIICAFAAATFWGLLAGMTQFMIEPILIWAIARWVLRKRPPLALGAIMVALFLVLQPVKTYYRQFMGSGVRSFTPSEAISAYASLTRQYWTSVGQSGAVLLQGQASAGQRLSMLHQTAHYIELTPRYIDYKGPRTILYPMYSWMPRVLWPDKPTAQEANKTLPVEYGIQSPENVATTMFGVGHVAEVYTGLGMAGIMPIFFILGLLYAAPRIALGEEGSLAATAALIWFAVTLTNISSTIGTVFGGLLQQLVVLSIVFRILNVGAHKREKPTVRTEVSGLAPAR
jgi:hypothetical protein